MAEWAMCLASTDHRMKLVASGGSNRCRAIQRAMAYVQPSQEEEEEAAKMAKDPFQMRCVCVC